MRTKSPLFGMRALLFVTFALHVCGFYQLFKPVYEEGILFSSRRWESIWIASVAVILFDLLLVIMSWTGPADWMGNKIGEILRRIAPLRWFNVLFYAIAVAVLTYLVYGFAWGLVPPGSLTILAIFWTVALTGAFLLKAWGYPQHPISQLPWLVYMGISFLLTTFVYRIASFLPDISTYPFTLTWSETSRYYYASLFFGKTIYGFEIPPTVLHPSRYLLQSLPFLIPGSPLWMHRAWQVILWLGLSLLTAYVIVRRLSIQNRLWQWISTLWIFLFLLIGPVYYHLQIPVILICLGFNRLEIQPVWKRNVISMICILSASIWAGISRINWFPVPGMLAVSFWLLHIPVQKTPVSGGELEVKTGLRTIMKYLLLPAAWFFLSLGTAFLSQTLYILGSGNPASEFTSSFSSGLLWYRLWPNPTFLIGILPGSLLISLPLFLMIWLRLREVSGDRILWRSIHFIRLLGLAAIPVVLFITGLVVSVKIGGGSNLHNMDSYMVLLLVITANFFFRRVTSEHTQLLKKPVVLVENNLIGNKSIQLALGLALLIVGLFSVLGRAPVSALPDQKSIERAFKELNQNIEKAKTAGGDILFISNRHLITFNKITGIRLVPEFERVFLMEMAMAGNSAYLDRFHNDLREHRFSLIVSEPLFLRQKDENEIFGEENNAWVQAVSRYVLCYYREENRARSVNMQLFTPNTKPGKCP